jgi:hypothetical protein
VATDKTVLGSRRYASFVSFVGFEKWIGRYLRPNALESNVGMPSDLVGMPTEHHLLFSEHHAVDPR